MDMTCQDNDWNALMSHDFVLTRLFWEMSPYEREGDIEQEEIEEANSAQPFWAGG